jgi:predicted AAA+ superfamily ATPase
MLWRRVVNLAKEFALASGLGPQSLSTYLQNTRDFVSMLTRVIKIPESLDFFLFGPRATGKTTLLSELFQPQTTFTVNLLLPEVLEQMLENQHAFRQTLEALPATINTVIIDEVQRIPGLLDVVQDLIQKERFRFILTGSSARKLKRGHANLLGGRAVTRTLGPLSFFEIPNTPAAFESKLFWGGLPKVFLAKNNEERCDLLRAYVQTYLAEEVVAEQLVRQLNPFRKFLQIAAQMNGQIINCNAIGRDIGTSHNTVSSYFEILEDTLIGFSLPAYHTSLRKRVRSKSKFFLFDTGVCRALARTLEHHPQQGTSAYGTLFEHMLIVEFRTLASYLKPDWEMSFYQTASGNEIDLIIDAGGGEIYAIEIKSALDISKVNLNSEISLLEEIQSSKKIVLSRDPLRKKISNNVVAMHWRDGLIEIFGAQFDLSSHAKN